MSGESIEIDSELWYATLAECARLKIENAALTDHVDLMADEFKRIKELMHDTPGARYSAEVVGLCDRAVAVTKPRVPVIMQRDNAEAEHAELRHQVVVLTEEARVARGLHLAAVGERDAARESLTLLERKAWAYLNNREHPEFDVDWVDHLIQRAQSERNARLEVEAARDTAQREAAQYRAEHGLLRDDLVAVHRVLMSDIYATFDPVQLPAIVENIMAERDRFKAELSDCPTCEGTGVMQVLLRVEPPDGREVYEDAECGECGGHGKSSWAVLKSENAQLRADLAESQQVLQTTRQDRAVAEAGRSHWRANFVAMTAKRDALFEEATAMGRELAVAHQQVRDLNDVIASYVGSTQKLKTDLAALQDAHRQRLLDAGDQYTKLEQKLTAERAHWQDAMKEALKIAIALGERLKLALESDGPAQSGGKEESRRLRPGTTPAVATPEAGKETR